MEFKDPPWFGRLYKGSKVKELTDLRNTVSKGDAEDGLINDSKEFEGKCLAAIIKCNRLAKRYDRYTIIAQFLSVFLSILAGVPSIISWRLSLSIGCTSAFFSVVNYIFKWGPMSEKYNSLKYQFKHLLTMTDIQKRNQLYNEYVILLENAILEQDMQIP